MGGARSRGAAGVAVQLAAEARLRTQDELKQQAAWKAVEYVKSGMKIGAWQRRRARFAPRARWPDLP